MEDLGPWRGFDMLALFVPECVIDEDTEPFPWREEMLKRLQQGQPVINRKYIHAMNDSQMRRIGSKIIGLPLRT